MSKAPREGRGPHGRLALDDPRQVLDDIEDTVLDRYSGADVGLLIECMHEHTVHEFAHLVTLGIDARRAAPHDIEMLIERELSASRRPRINAFENEIRTLAAELRVLDALGVVESAQLFLEYIASNLEQPTIPSRVARRLTGRRYRLAIEDAYATIDAIQAYAAARRDQD